MISWVIGRGLLGTHVERELSRKGVIWSTREPLRWHAPAEIDEQFSDSCRAFAAAARGQRWQVAWCTGAGVVASTSSDLDAETAALASFLHRFGASMTGAPEGSLFLASSAGGVYAGGVEPPFTERSPTRPLSLYGETKLQQEALVRGWAEDRDVAVLVGRIANLFGPGQDIAKPQGLISQLAAAMLLRRPLTVYVPLDTIRDYLFAPDCARMVAAGLDRLGTERAGTQGTTTKIFASGKGVTVASVLAELRRVLRRSPGVSLASSPLTRLQPPDLRFRSEVWADLDTEARTPLPVAVHALVRDLERQLQQGTLRRAAAH